MDRKFSLKAAFVAALMLGAATSADAYSLGGGGGTGAKGYADRIVLDYPDGSEQRFLLPYLPRKATEAQQQEYYDAAVVILRDYMRDIMPKMSNDKREDFAWIVDRMSEDYFPLIADAKEFCNEINYDYALVKRYQLERRIDDFLYFMEEFKVGSLDEGYRIYPKAVYDGEYIVDSFNGILAELKTEFPYHRAYQMRPFTYDVLHDVRRILAAEIADILIKFSKDLDNGQINPPMVNKDVQGFISMTAMLLADPSSLDDREKFNTAAYNVFLPQYIDDALAQNHGLSENERNTLYQKLFTVRHSYDLRPVPHEKDFMAGRDVIGAPVTPKP